MFIVLLLRQVFFVFVSARSRLHRAVQGVLKACLPAIYFKQTCFVSHDSHFAVHTLCFVSCVVRGGKRPAVTPQSLKQTGMCRLWWCWTTSPGLVTPQLRKQMKASSSSWRKAQSCWLWKWRGWRNITWRMLAAKFLEHVCGVATKLFRLQF